MRGNQTSITDHTTLGVAICMDNRHSKGASIGKKPKLKLTNNDLELSGLVLGWILLEYVVGDLTFKHIGRCCDNESVVSWE